MRSLSLLSVLIFAPATLADDNSLPDRKAVVGSLIDSLNDADPEVRQNLAVALSRLAPESIQPLTIAVKDHTAERRSGAALALGLIGPAAESALPTLLDALKDSELDVRRQASYAISLILTPSRTRPLLDRTLSATREAR